MNTTPLIEYITNCCSCKIDNMSQIIDININESQCAEIKLENIKNFNKHSVKYIITLYKKLGILVYKSEYKKYFILGKRFTWNKVKQLTVDDLYDYYNNIKIQEINKIFSNKTSISLNVTLTYIKYLIWYFRKHIVDSTIINILGKYANKKTKYKSKNIYLKAFSVGSTKLDSDYDITLTGDSIDIADTIYIFNHIIQNIFNEPPDVVFDTNLYGLSFITNGTTYTCNATSFDIRKPEQEKTQIFSIMQNVWVLIKVLLTMDYIKTYDEIMYNILYQTMYSIHTIYNPLIYVANQFLQVYTPNPDNYAFIIRGIKEFSSNMEFMNYISFINYNGLDTYYSRGAFLDVVINTQMCKGDIVPLGLNDYYDSFIENNVDLLTHYHKTKYTVRIFNSFNNFKKILQEHHPSIYTQSTNYIDTIDYHINKLQDLQSTCTRGVLDCSRLLISDLCIKNIFMLSTVYLLIYDTDTIKLGLQEFTTQYNTFPDITKIKVDKQSNKIIQDLSPITLSIN